MAARQRRASAIAVGLVLLALIQAASSPANAEQRLENGGFEQGTTGWSSGSVGFSTSGCPPRSGSTAGALVATVDDGQGQQAQLRQTITNIASGNYTLKGHLRLLSGSGTVNVALSWRDASGQELLPTADTATPGSSTYADFTLTEPSSPPDARSVLVRISITSATVATLCLDDLSLDGPPPATATPFPTATATPTSTPTPTHTPTPTSTPLLAVSPSPTAAPTASATAAPSPTSTAGSSQPPPPPPGSGRLQFINGGFEDGILGWQKFGGELAAVSQPRYAGGSAGAFTSNTTSTKWAYQAVAIDPSAAYEFAGHLRTDGGIAAAYLRISWYASGDGSGTALATDDSTNSLGPSSDGFFYLTTGPRRPPAEARSARLRVMLAPQGGSPATLYLDGFSFGEATLPAVQAPPPSAVVAPDESAPATIPPALPASHAAATAAPSSSTELVTTPTPSMEIAGVTNAGQSRTPAGIIPTLEEAETSSDGVSVLVIGAGVLVFGAAFAGAYIYSHPALLTRLVRGKPPNL